MFIPAAVIFGIAAIIGLRLAYYTFAYNSASTILAVIHGLFAATGLVLLIIGLTVSQATGLRIASLIIFLVAATGGFIMFFGFQMKQKALPRLIVLAHGSAAVTAFVILLISLIKA